MKKLPLSDSIVDRQNATWQRMSMRCGCFDVWSSQPNFCPLSLSPSKFLAFSKISSSYRLLFSTNSAAAQPSPDNHFHTENLHIKSMAAVTRIYVPPYGFDRPMFVGGLVMMETIAAPSGTCKGKYRAFCRSFRSEEGDREVGKRRIKNTGGLRALRFAVERKSEELSSRFTELLASGVVKVEEALSKVAVPVARYIVTLMSTGVVLAVGFQMSGGDSQMNTLIWYSWLGGVIIGTMIGANMVLDEHCRSGPRNVVITGSTRGLGKALAREFLLSGDRVVVASRSTESVDMTVKELEEIIQEGVAAGDSRHKNLANAKVVGIACDVCNHDDVKRLADYAVDQFGSIDIWINNAGMNKGFRPLLEFTDEDITQIVSTNLVGSLLCTREAMRVMKKQGKGGHIFNMDGAGSGGSSTPLTAAYGATKCGLRQLQSSLLKECKRSNIGVHTASPGMVLTDLLLSGSTIQNKQMFNIICELPETVARTLVPRIRIVKGNGKAINYLTPPRILLALVTVWLRQGRWFDDQGRALYAAEADRIRNWAEDRTRFSFTDAMEMYTENTWVSVFSLSVVCAFIIISSTSGSTFPGT